MSLVLSILFTVAAAASPRPQLLVTSKWLAQHLHDPNLVVLHVGEKEGYDAGHIPGARYVKLSDISVSSHAADGLMTEMPPAEELRKDLENLGISDGSRVVIYTGSDWVSHATRILFTLDYAGLGTRGAILDGGLGAWKEAGGEVTADVPAPRTGKLSKLKIKPIVVDAAFVNAHLAKPGFRVIDGRSASFYDGADTGEHMGEKQRTGHIHNAGSLPFTEVWDDKQFLKSPAELKALLDKAGVKPGDTVIGYCHIGQQATSSLLAARLLGHRVLLYDGSFQDWSRRASYPVDNPAAGTK